jgi:hypothetical protein
MDSITRLQYVFLFPVQADDKVDLTSRCRSRKIHAPGRKPRTAWLSGERKRLHGV